MSSARPDPANLQPWVIDLARQHQQEYYKARPMYQCRPSGPEAERFGGWKRILQTPTAIAILNDDLTYRVIHMDGRELEANPAPSWMGYSVGRWEGDTLVVDSNGFNDKTWVSRYGVSHTEALRMTERYRRPDFGHLQLEVTFTDPGAYAKPWGFTADMALAADTEMLEAVCERSSDAMGRQPLGCRQARESPCRPKCWRGTSASTAGYTAEISARTKCRSPAAS